MYRVNYLSREATKSKEGKISAKKQVHVKKTGKNYT